MRLPVVGGAQPQPPGGTGMKVAAAMPSRGKAPEVTPEELSSSKQTENLVNAADLTYY